MRAILLMTLLTACGGDGESNGAVDAAPALPCDMDVTRFYADGCTFSRPDGTTISQFEVRQKCGQHIATAAPGCTSRAAEFGACLMYGGVGVFCEGPPQ